MPLLTPPTKVQTTFHSHHCVHILFSINKQQSLHSVLNHRFWLYHIQIASHDQSTIFHIIQPLSIYLWPVCPFKFTQILLHHRSHVVRHDSDRIPPVRLVSAIRLHQCRNATGSTCTIHSYSFMFEPSRNVFLHVHRDSVWQALSQSIELRWEFSSTRRPLSPCCRQP